MKNIYKHPLFITIVGVSLLAAFFNFSSVLSALQYLNQLFLPIIAGAILALFLHVPINALQTRLEFILSKQKNKPSKRTIEIISFVLTIIFILFLLILVLTLLVPEIVQSSQNLYLQIQQNIQNNTFSEYELGWLSQVVDLIDLQQITNYLSSIAKNLLSNTMGILSSTANLMTTAVFSIIIAIYISLGKAQLKRHITLVMEAYLPKQTEKIFYCCRLFLQSFTNFLTGQCLEAVILGTLMFIAFSIAGLPYGSMVGLLTAICAIIPYVGALISGGISVLLTFVINPALAIKCLIVYVVVQFVENQFIYPKVVGKSVGLSPFYTLIAAMIGGKIFGVIGILFFIPLTATVLELVKTDIQHRNKQNS